MGTSPATTREETEMARRRKATVISAKDIREVRKRSVKGESVRKIARAMQISPSYVHRIIRREVREDVKCPPAKSRS